MNTNKTIYNTTSTIMDLFVSNVWFPIPIKKLVSDYLFHFDVLEVLSNFAKIDKNTILYLIDNYPYNKSLESCIRGNFFHLLHTIMDNYNNKRVALLRNIYPYLTEEIRNKYYESYSSYTHFDFASTIILHACIRREKDFLDDFIVNFDVDNRASHELRTKYGPTGIKCDITKSIDTRNMARVLIEKDDPESLKFMFSYFIIDSRRIESFLFQQIKVITGCKRRNMLDYIKKLEWNVLYNKTAINDILNRESQ